MTVALYIRTSTDRQDKGLESQRKLLEDYCKAHNIHDYQIYQDVGVSGTKESRPGLNRLMDDVRAKRIYKVIVPAFSRFARSTSHLISALEEFQRLRVSFVSVTENIDTATPMGKTLFIIISAIGMLERDLIAERVKAGLANAKSKGIKLGRKKTRNSDLIKELHKQGLSYRKIARLAKCSLSTVHREIKGSSKK